MENKRIRKQGGRRSKVVPGNKASTGANTSKQIFVFCVTRLPETGKVIRDDLHSRYHPENISSFIIADTESSAAILSLIEWFFTQLFFSELFMQKYGARSAPG
jgi:hypothetical protein